MATKVIMPKQGLQMTEGTIINWIVKEGEDCVEGQPLFEMETDKLTITIDAPATGTLLKIVKGEGEVVPITEIIAVIGQPGEDVSGFVSGAPADAAAKAPVAATVEAPAPAPIIKSGSAKRMIATPRAAKIAAEKGFDVTGISGSGPDGLVIERDVLAFTPSKALEVKTIPLAATPLAKKIAALEGVEISKVAASGAYGKVTKDDILAAVASRTSGKVRGEKLIPLTGMRKAISTNMVKSLTTTAQTVHHIKVDMTNAAQLRDTYKKLDKKISYNDLVLRAAARTLTEFPMMNSQLTAEGVLVKEYVNLGIAVALDEGLIVPNIKDADLMTLEEISIVAKELAGKAKDGTLTMDEYSGGTFTVSNLGMFGLDFFTAIINPPEVGILAVGKVIKEPVVVDDEVVIKPMMTLTLSYDHRVVDGAPAAQFVSKLAQYIEYPCLMV